MDENSKVCKILVIGENGAGKSSMINTLLKDNKCKAGQTFKRGGITDGITQYEMAITPEEEKLEGITLYDTPPFDQLKLKWQVSDRFHVIVLVFPMIRLTPERLEFLEDVRNFFGNEVFRHLIIIFNKYEEENEAKEQVKLAEDPMFSTFQEKSKLLFLDNYNGKENSEYKIKQFKAMLPQFMKLPPIGKRKIYWAFIRAIFSFLTLRRSND